MLRRNGDSNPTLCDQEETKLKNMGEQRLGGIEGRRRRGRQRTRGLDGITDAVSMNLGTLWEMVTDREALYFIHLRLGPSSGDLDG